MELKTKKVVVPLEKIASMYADAQKLDVDELVKLARQKAAEKGISEEEALFEVVRDKSKMSATIVPLRAWVPQARAGESEGIAMSTLAAVIDEDGRVEVRTVKAYPDDEESMRSVENVGVGMVGKPQTVWKLTGRQSEEIKDESGVGIIGIKKIVLVDDTTEFKKDSVAEEISNQYKKMMKITGKALENFSESVKRLKEDKKNKRTYFDAVAETIASFEEAGIMIMSDLRIPRKRDDGRELKPRLECIGFIDRRGVSHPNEFNLYYDSAEEVLAAKARLKPPVVATSNNVFELRTQDAESQESIPMIDALGRIKMGVRGLVIVAQGEKVVEDYKEDYENVLDVCDPTKKKSFRKPVERAASQKVEFYMPMIAPFAMINGISSSVDDTTKNATLRLILSDGKMTVLANMYGASALEVVRADSVESFKDAVSRMHGGVVKDMRFFGARTHRVDEKSGEDIFFITISSIHSYEEPTDDEANGVFAADGKE